MKYFVAANLKHDLKDYSRGDVITLAEDVGQPLVDAGVLSTTAELPAHPKPDVVVEDEVRAEEPAAADTSGEPSFDGPKPKAAKGKKGKSIDPSANL